MPMTQKRSQSMPHVDPAEQSTEARRQVETWCQALVDAGAARWRINDAGDAELETVSGEAYRLDDAGVTRCK